MEVQVPHGVAGVFAHVGDEPVARVGDSFRLRRPASEDEQVRQDRAVVHGYRCRMVDVSYRHDQHMDRRLRAQVTKCEPVSATRHLVGGDRPGDDAAEQTVGVGHAYRLLLARSPPGLVLGAAQRTHCPTAELRAGGPFRSG